MRAYIGGTYDILHAGHIKLFRWAKLTYGQVVVALNKDAFVERYKGKPPAIPFYERYIILNELRCVDAVIGNIGDEDSTVSILLAKPTVIVAGSDWTRERLMVQMGLTQEFLNKNNISISIFEDSDPTHSSDIKKRI